MKAGLSVKYNNGQKLEYDEDKDEGSVPTLFSCEPTCFRQHVKFNFLTHLQQKPGNVIVTNVVHNVYQEFAVVFTTKHFGGIKDLRDVTSEHLFSKDLLAFISGALL